MKVRKGKQVIDLLNMVTTAARTFNQCCLCFGSAIEHNGVLLVKITRDEASNFYGEGREVRISLCKPQGELWKNLMVSRRQSLLDNLRVLTFREQENTAKVFLDPHSFQLQYWVRIK